MLVAEAGDPRRNVLSSSLKLGERSFFQLKLLLSDQSLGWPAFHVATCGRLRSSEVTVCLTLIFNHFHSSQTLFNNCSTSLRLLLCIPLGRFGASQPDVLVENVCKLCLVQCDFCHFGHNATGEFSKGAEFNSVYNRFESMQILPGVSQLTHDSEAFLRLQECPLKAFNAPLKQKNCQL